MSASLLTTQSDSLPGILSSIGLPMERLAPGAWVLSEPETALRIRCFREDELLVLKTDPSPDSLPRTSGTTIARAKDLLEASARFFGNLRFQWSEDRGWMLGSEVVLFDAPSDGAKVHTVLLQMRQAWRLLGAGGDPVISDSTADLGDSASPAADFMSALAQSVGWPCHDREDGSRMFDLETGLALTQARLHGLASGKPRLAVKLVDWGKLPVSSQRVLGPMLARLNAVIRLCRASITSGDRGEVACLEICWPECPAPEELVTGLEAMTAVLRKFGAALLSLVSAEVADACVEMGMGSPP